MNRLKKQLSQILIWKKKIDLYELLPHIDFDLSKILKFFKKINYKESLRLYKDKAHIIKQIDLKKISCSTCEGRGYVFDNFFENIYKQYKEICKNRPVNLPEFDQGSILEKDVIKRVEFIYERGDLLDSDILVIGDDDLISIALGLTKLPKKIYVLEIDKRLIDYIETHAHKLNLPIKTLQYDARNLLPKELINRFDIFITDPPETLKSLKTFLSRGIQSLKTQGAGYFGLTTIESSLDKWFGLEKFIIETGFVITDIKRKFSVYPFSKEDEEWQYFKDKIKIFKSIGEPKIKNWYYSSFIRIEKIKNIKIKNITHKINPKNFYLDEETLITPEMDKK
jgi:predicted methyltransferase